MLLWLHNDVVEPEPKPRNNNVTSATLSQAVLLVCPFSFLSSSSAVRYMDKYSRNNFLEVSLFKMRKILRNLCVTQFYFIILNEESQMATLCCSKPNLRNLMLSSHLKEDMFLRKFIPVKSIQNNRRN
jgi:hypothetical protein